MNLVAFGQRGQPSVGRQDADLSAGAAGQVAAARFVFGLRTQVPTPHLAVLIQRHQLTIRGESTADDGDTVPRENRGACFPASAGSSTTQSRADRASGAMKDADRMIGVDPRSPSVRPPSGLASFLGNVFRQQDAELFGRGCDRRARQTGRVAYRSCTAACGPPPRRFEPTARPPRPWTGFPRLAPSAMRRRRGRLPSPAEIAPLASRFGWPSPRFVGPSPRFVGPRPPA